MVRVVEALYVSLQSCVFVLYKSPTLGDETCNIICCSPIKKQTSFGTAVGPQRRAIWRLHPATARAPF
jgi:hypothetical protein